MAELEDQTTLQFAWDRWKNGVGGVAGFGCLVLLPAGLGIIGGLGPTVNIGAAAVGALIGAVAGPALFFIVQLMIAPYVLLGINRAKRKELEDRLKPQFALSLEPPGVSHTVESRVDSHNPPNPPVRKNFDANYIRVRVDTLTNHYANCTGHIVECTASNGTRDFADIKLPVRLDLESAEASVGVPGHIEVARVSSFDNKLVIPNWPLSLTWVLEQYRLIRLKVVAASWDQSVPLWIELSWHGEWNKITAKEVASGHS